MGRCGYPDRAPGSRAPGRLGLRSAAQPQPPATKPGAIRQAQPELPRKLRACHRCITTSPTPPRGLMISTGMTGVRPAPLDGRWRRRRAAPVTSLSPAGRYMLAASALGATAVLGPTKLQAANGRTRGRQEAQLRENSMTNSLAVPRCAHTTASCEALKPPMHRWWWRRARCCRRRAEPRLTKCWPLGSRGRTDVPRSACPVPLA